MHPPDTSLPSQIAPKAPWILVVDDEPSMRSLIEVVLRAEGWTVRACDGAAEALEAIKAAATPPAVVV